MFKVNAAGLFRSTETRHDAGTRLSGVVMTRQQRLTHLLAAAFTPTAMEVRDDSAQHAGHSGASAAGETHYTVRMTSAAFAAQSRVARSRAVHAAVATEFSSGLHALSLQLRAPDEI